jgi:hypothetical protein
MGRASKTKTVLFAGIRKSEIMRDQLIVWRENFGQIKSMVDACERFHKHAQLHGSPIFIPILNESRYLARALIDAIYHITEGTGEDSDNAAIDALARARIAASSALHDTVDEILAITVKFLVELEAELERRKCSPILVEYLDADTKNVYVQFLQAYGRVAEKIAYSRANRREREGIYIKLLSVDGENRDFEVILQFFLKLREFETKIFATTPSPQQS